MAEKETLGGKRLGSGKQMEVKVDHNYMMNSFNLEQDFKSSMAPGVLYPFLKLIGMNHGTFDIDLDSFIRTLPTKGPLFGSFKLQLDIFSCPFRLYQGILHNNPIDLGMKMKQVYLPKLMYQTIDGANAPRVAGTNEDTEQVATNALIKYLGISGAGHHDGYASQVRVIRRKFNAVPILAYYDIFKQYYSNKQEEMAYVIEPGNFSSQEQNPTGLTINYERGTVQTSDPEARIYAVNEGREGSAGAGAIASVEINGTNINPSLITAKLTHEQTEIQEIGIEQYGSIRRNGNNYTWEINNDAIIDEFGEWTYLVLQFQPETNKINSDIVLTPFNLKNIDDMRYKLLATNQIGQEFIIGDQNMWTLDSGTDGTGLPYSALFKVTDEGISYNAFKENGLLVKTYQSDLFNNWLDNEYVDMINEMTKVDTSTGGFTIDDLILGEKVYELLNRILVKGGTYQDWQEAVYGEGAMRMVETPMYIGGMSAEVMFEEVISSSETKIDGDFQALGALGGKGTQVGKKGGNNIHVKMDEPGYVIGIVSLTPRISYSQGNDWDMTDLDSIDDLHKPALDGIGFQDLMAEQLAWWNTLLDSNGQGIITRRDSIGKQTAWINYQTAIDKCYGDFADQEGYAFMVLNRNYEHDGTTGIKDVTTYIDPAKYNYAFAVSDLSAQNFWAQIHSRVIARRKMGAQQLPNL